MNYTMEIIASLPGSSIGKLFLDPVCALLLELFIFLSILILNRKRGIPVYLAMLTLCGILLQSAQIRYSRLQSSQVSVSHFKNSSMVTFRVGLHVNHYIRCADSTSMDYINRYQATAWGNRCYETSVMRNHGNGKHE